VRTVLPCHATSRGRPTLTDSNRAITLRPSDDAIGKWTREALDGS